MAKTKKLEFTVQVPERYLRDMSSHVSDMLQDEFGVKLKAKEILSREDFQAKALRFIQERLDELATHMDTYDFVFEYDIEKVFAEKIAEAYRLAEEEERREAEEAAALQAKQPAVVSFKIPRDKTDAILAMLRSQGVSPTVT